jgi:thiosulfate/3-mercaptopyruvate sulfurtransferase
MTLSDDPLVPTEWLAARLGDARLRVLDASFKLPGASSLTRDDFLAAHIPGAAFFDVDAVADHTSDLPHMYPSAAQFARDIAALGVSTGDTVVLYDSGSWMAAPRAWWMFLAFGHPSVKVLDGGLKKWRAEGRATESGAVTPAPGRFTASFDPAFVRNRRQIEDNLATHTAQVVDARSRERFEGRAAEPRPGLRAGHIPGSRNVPYSDLIDPATATMKPLADLRAAFETAGIALDRPLVTSCGSGVSAGVLTLALYRLGVRGSALYDGSWAEWGLPDGPPLATGLA